MSNPGYLYVLVNSSMPGLVKVGKTNRSPADRAGELSGVTGVPTPFLVAFEQFFEDCDAAEDFVHTELEHMNYRMSPNREFFNVPVNIVIRTIMRAPGQIDPANFNLEESADDSLLGHTEDDLSAIQLVPDKPLNPWDDILTEAGFYHHGIGDKIEDHREALRLYKQAAKLGSLVAYECIGDMYRYGQGVREDHEQALQYYKEGARRGNYYCYMHMAGIFAFHRHQSNFQKCVNFFFEKRRNKTLEEVEESNKTFAFTCLSYIRNCINNQYLIDHVEEMREEKVNILAAAGDLIDRGAGSEIMDKTQRWIRDNL